MREAHRQETRVEMKKTQGSHCYTWVPHVRVVVAYSWSSAATPVQPSPLNSPSLPAVIFSLVSVGIS
jgi:hypothetical protein